MDNNQKQEFDEVDFSSVIDYVRRMQIPTRVTRPVPRTVPRPRAQPLPLVSPQQAQPPPPPPQAITGPPREFYYTYLGDENGMPYFARMNNPRFFNQDGVDDYLRKSVRFLPYRENLNAGYPEKGPVHKERLRRFFDLPQDFLDSFTDNWGVMTIFQWNKTRERYYLMVIIHNGRYESELEVILHMAHMDGDHENIKIYEAKNYDSYDDIPLGRFNVDWNDFTLAMQDDCRYDYSELPTILFTHFHRHLQYMLLSFYKIMTEEDENLGRDGVSLINSQPWYDESKSQALYLNITYIGLIINCYMVVLKEQRNAAGRRVLVEHIKRH